ncbi:MAG: HD-GYP domain-containing protein [Actinomycetota bacterium]|nr:HD-GYP domain-containing protein [Actinomycetota bacterium]
MAAKSLRSGEQAGGIADASHVAALITLVACAASAAFVLFGGDAWRAASEDPGKFVTFVLLAVSLQLAAVEIYGRGALSFSGMGMLAVGFALGPGAGMVAGVLVATVNLIHQWGRLERSVFNAANLSLSVLAGAGAYHLIGAADWNTAARLVPAFAAGIVFMVVNVGLLSLAMSMSEQIPMRAIWRERFRWFTPYYLVSGPLALATTVAFEEAGLIGLIAFGLPPALMMFSIRQYISRTRESVEEVRHANEELQLANADLQELFGLASGLAARSHDERELVKFAEDQVGRLTGAVAGVELGLAQAGVPLVSGGNHIGSLVFDDSEDFDRERWSRLRDAILPQLATALESSQLIGEMRKQHLATIAALSRSIEAKDGSTGEHTERVAPLAVELARRLGFAGADLDAIEIGALLHDIGKIGVPEVILHKPGPLSEDEWQIMRRHPLVSEHILSGIGLSPIVMRIARSSHERFDGEGYPDGLSGETIPLPARIVLVADAFDAMTSNRPYRPARRLGDALAEIRAHTGTQFCPLVVTALEQLYRDRPELLGAQRLQAVRDVA